MHYHALSIISIMLHCQKALQRQYVFSYFQSHPGLISLLLITDFYQSPQQPVFRGHWGLNLSECLAKAANATYNREDWGISTGLWKRRKIHSEVSGICVFLFRPKGRKQIRYLDPWLSTSTHWKWNKKAHFALIVMKWLPSREETNNTPRFDILIQRIWS